jgi:hypothetical protein
MKAGGGVWHAIGKNIGVVLILVELSMTSLLRGREASSQDMGLFMRGSNVSLGSLVFCYYFSLHSSGFSVSERSIVLDHNNKLQSIIKLSQKK